MSVNRFLSPKDNYWILDLEADSLRPNTIWCVVVKNVVSKKVEKFIEKQQFNDWRKKELPVFVGHNLLSFDVPVLNSLWSSGIALGDCIETLVISYLGDPQREGGHSLESWGKRFQYPKIEFDDWSKFSQEMLEYCEQDVNLTLRLYEYQCQTMSEFSELSLEIEHKTRIIIDKMQQKGVKFDVMRARALRDSLREKERQLEEDIHKVFPPKRVVAGVYDYKLKKDGTPYESFFRHSRKYPDLQFNRSGTKYRVFEEAPFNIGSPKQRVERLLSIGWKPTKRTKKGGYTVDEETLLEFAEKSGNKAVAHMAEWLVCKGRANMIDNWLGYVDNASQRIHPRVFSCGAGTRRMRHTNPNTANIPGVEALYGRECRGFWYVDVGRKLVGCDAKGLEARVLVHYLNNRKARDYFLVGDPHQSNADAIGCERSPSKNIFYAFLYGASDQKLGTMVGKDSKEGSRIRDVLKNNIPGLKSLVEETEAEFKRNNGLLQTIDGGFVRCPSPHAALNYKFQSAGAILMKKAAIILDDWVAPYDAFKVLDVHDEWQFDVAEEEAEIVGNLMVRSIHEAGKILRFNVEMDGEYKIGNNWAETH